MTGFWIGEGGMCVCVCARMCEPVFMAGVVPCLEKRVKEQEILELTPLWSAVLFEWGFLIVWCLHSVG